MKSHPNFKPIYNGDIIFMMKSEQINYKNKKLTNENFFDPRNL